MSSRNYGELEAYARIMDAIRRLKQSRIIGIRQDTKKMITSKRWRIKTVLKLSLWTFQD